MWCIALNTVCRERTLEGNGSGSTRRAIPNFEIWATVNPLAPRGRQNARAIQLTYFVVAVPLQESIPISSCGRAPMKRLGVSTTT